MTTYQAQVKCRRAVHIDQTLAGKGKARALHQHDAIALGFPEAGPFYVSPLRVRAVFAHTGDDIYRTGQVTREVYAVRGLIRQGNSGGPMINRGGQVLGVVFGAAVDDADTGFVLTAKEVAPQMAKVGNTQRVPTGVCVS